MTREAKTYPLWGTSSITSVPGRRFRYWCVRRRPRKKSLMRILLENWACRVRGRP